LCILRPENNHQESLAIFHLYNLQELESATLVEMVNDKQNFEPPALLYQYILNIVIKAETKKSTEFDHKLEGEKHSHQTVNCFSANSTKQHRKRQLVFQTCIHMQTKKFHVNLPLRSAYKPGTFPLTTTQGLLGWRQ
jgi:hypothetical protein